MVGKGKAENIRVCARFRPQNEREKTQSKEKRLKYEVDRGNTSVTFHGVGPNVTQTNRTGVREEKTNFNLDRIYKEDSTQDEVFEWISNNIVKHCFEGYNGTIFAYGQTSSGKTHTMFGPDNYLDTPDDWGIVPKSISELFNFVLSSPAGWEFSISTSYFQLYKERIQDLLKPANNNLKIHESKARGIFIEGLSSEYLEDVQNLLDVLTVGGANKTVASTDMNSRSSRSHSVLQVTLVQKNEEGSSKTGKFTFVDLAGSERVDKTNAVGQTFEEAKKINLSLTCLANVIKSLSSGSAHIPYRDSKLTRILQESLGGNTKTMLILCCSPDLSNIEETLSTLRFGKSAKNIKNQVKVNVRRSAQELEYMLKRLQDELAVERKQVEGLKAEIDWMKSPDYNPENKPEVEEEAQDEFDIEDRMMMEQELESKQVRIDSLQEELSTLHGEHEVSLKDLKDKSDSLDQVQASLKKLEAAAKVDFRKIEQLEFDLQASKSDRNVIGSQVDAWKQKVEAANAARERLQQASDKLKADISVLEESKIEMSERMLESEKENMKLQEDLSSAREEAMASAQSSEKLKIDLNHIEEKLSNSEKKSKTMAESLRELQASSEAAQEEVKSLEAKMSTAETNFTRAEEENKSLRETLEASRAEFESDSKEQQSKVENLESKLKDSQKVYEELNSNFKEQNLLRDQAEQDLARHKKQWVESKSLLEATIKEHEESKKQLEESLVKEKEMSSTLDSQLLDLRKSLHKHRNTMLTEAPQLSEAPGDDSVGQVEALFQTIDKYKKLNSEYAEKNKKIEETSTELRKEVMKLNEEKKNLVEQGEVKNQEHAKELVELENKMSTQISEEKGRTMDLRTKLMEKRSVLMKLTTEKKGAEKKHQDSVQEVKALQEKAEEKAEKITSLEANSRHQNSVIARIHKEKEEAHEAHLEKLSKLELEKLQLGVDIEQLKEQKEAISTQLSESKEKVAAQKIRLTKEQMDQEKLKGQCAQLKEELDSSKNAILEAQNQAEESSESAKKELEALAGSLETSRSMIQKQADHISGLESELSDRDEQIRELQELQQSSLEERQEMEESLAEVQDKYDKLVAEMPMRVRAKIFKPVLGGVEKALKEKIDLGGVRANLKRVGRRSMVKKDPPPPPPPKEDT
ncbi:kinesin [Chloropicon primus]|uniref:Kinesin n=1 Tax=Chloropicon primus TaxID=1764295 RepID=A0A5B8MI02_9CHLO|nr:kinesin [Chloropicon primus]UPQ98210.1 kinesin [Chloropicon primus]|eukprot:QDZ19002.1 kinesin [Chloropicon primus]